MQAAPLSQVNTQNIPDAQGVYQLMHAGQVKYIGKTDAQRGLRTRLARHARKFQHRQGISPNDVTFKAVQVFVLTAMDVETELISHYGTKSHWNSSGFGSNDPGRQRETTNQKPDSFDAIFPIDIDRFNLLVPTGTYTVADVLRRLKDTLPYTFRYETSGSGSQAYRTSPHSDYTAAQVTIPSGPHTARQLLRLVLSVLPEGWQATQFGSHIILYKESRSYLYGRPI